MKNDVKQEDRAPSMEFINEAPLILDTQSPQRII